MSEVVAKIRVRTLENEESLLHLNYGADLKLGRAEGNDLKLVSPKASRFHATIRSTGEGVFIQDLGSLNGTYVNGKLIGSSAPLKNGDRVELAGYLFTFEIIEGGVLGSARTDETKPLELQAFSGTVLVSDICGYTRLSEALPAKELTSVLRIWSERVTQVIELLDGTVDKFIGDSVLAHWLQKSPESSPQLLAEKAFAAAKRIEAETLSLESSVMWPFAPKHRWKVKSSLSSGEVIFGNVGRGEARSFTVFGDTVNKVFRLNDLCSSLGAGLLLDEETALLAGQAARFRLIEEMKLEGKDVLVKVYTLG